jgi:hypothetical protein
VQNYRRWLVQYGIHLGVVTAHKRGLTSLGEIRAEMDEAGLLDGFERRGDVWLLDVRRLGPFTTEEGGMLALIGGIGPEHFPMPGPPPAMIDAPPAEPEEASEAPASRTKGAKKR